MIAVPHEEVLGHVKLSDRNELHQTSSLFNMLPLRLPPVLPSHNPSISPTQSHSRLLHRHRSIGGGSSSSLCLLALLRFLRTPRISFNKPKLCILHDNITGLHACMSRCVCIISSFHDTTQLFLERFFGSAREARRASQIPKIRKRQLHLLNSSWNAVSKFTFTRALKTARIPRPQLQFRMD